MNALSPDTLIPFAEQLANLSGDVIRKYYGQPIDYDVKEDASPVTKADREVERTLLALVRQQFPEHGFIGEEYEAVNGSAEYVWMIDPIDGTKSFIIGRPIFGTLISLLHRNKPILGIIDQPVLGERWVGVEGFATRYNNEDIKTRSCGSLKNAVLCTTSPNLFEGNDRVVFEQLREQMQYTVYGGDCYSYGLLARGRVDVVIETGLKPYDFCALKPIIEGAGGVITDWEGRVLTAASDGRVIACGDRAIHTKIMGNLL